MLNLHGFLNRQMPQVLHTGFSLRVSHNPIAPKRFNFYRNLTLEMGTQAPTPPPPPKRPTCTSCSKPIRLCLCSRFKTPLFENPISVTILQHNQEKDHPLNSTRIAALGLKNLTVTSVSDVHFEAKFLITFLKPTHFDFSSDKRLDFGSEKPDISATIAKCGFTCSLMNLRVDNKSMEKPDFDKLLDSHVGQDAVCNGFMVKKLHKNKLEGCFEFEECEEFNIVVPPGSVLLFPAKKSITFEEVGYEVKHLIILDGTWAKAKRMYHENPWLKLLPHLKLDIKKMSLYSEVRQQPKLGYLSTIESMVCAMKMFGGDCVELDNLLDVFESMVVDQRRCKDERLSKESFE